MMEKSEKSKSNSPRIIMLAAALVAALGAHVAWASHFWSGVYLLFRSSAPWLLAAALVATAAASPAVLNALRSRRSGARGYHVPFGSGEYVLSGLAVVVALAVVAGLVVRGYETDVAYRIDVVEVTAAPSPDFEARFPYQIASGLMPRSVGDAENVRVSEPGYTDPQQGQWASLVSGVGWYRPSQGVVVKTASGFERCDWPSGSGSILSALAGDGGVGAREGLFGNDLGRQLRQVKRNTHIVWEGLGAWCTEEGPYVLIPSEAPRGILRTHRVQAGAWLIDPSGEITFVSTVTPGQFPVPAVSPRLARETIDANLRLDRTGQPAGWRSLTSSGRVGLERPESGWFAEEDGTENPDAGNAGEFLLRTTDGRWAYVTSLTPVGDSESVVALAVVYADEISSGGLPRTVIHRLPEDVRRRSNLEIVAELRTTFDSEVQWEAGYAVFELAPLSGGSWSATIGQSLEVKYRAVILPDGTSCLTLFATGETVRCSGEASSTLTQGRGPSADPSTLESLSDEELLDLMDQVLAELRSR